MNTMTIKIFLKQIVVRIVSWQARKVLSIYKPKIIAVTGSVGKTSTKDAIFAVMSGRFHVRKSSKSFNSEIGVPLTILGLPNAWTHPVGWIQNFIKGMRLIWFRGAYPEWLVLEVGADKPGDIKMITEWLKPDVAIITHIGTVPVHVEFFDSIEKLVEEKRYLAKALKKGGVLVLDGDDQGSLNTRDIVTSTEKIIICGKNAPAQIMYSNIGLTYDDVGRVSGMKFDIGDNLETIPVNLHGMVGSASVYPALMAYVIGKHLGLDKSHIVEALSRFEAPRGRKRIIDGIKDSTIIDDSYNSSPSALHNSLDLLKRIKTNGKKIAVLGDMMELGEYSAAEHYKAGAHAAEACDTLVVVGMRSRRIAEGALDASMSESHVFQYEDSREAGKFVESLIESKRNDIVLVKGSQSVRMERVVEEIMAHPEAKESLLVRQSLEWTKR